MTSLAERTVSTTLLSAALAGLMACSSGLEAARTAGYPPTFNYITDAQLQSSMWQLAAGVSDLEKILGSGTSPTAGQRVDVIRALDQMKAAADALGPEGWPSNHPRISQHLGGLTDKIVSARRAAAIDPPSYYLAGAISGACVACH